MAAHGRRGRMTLGIAFRHLSESLVPAFRSMATNGGRHAIRQELWPAPNYRWRAEQRASSGAVVQ
eukprot:9681792-Alexandrium_andersonii.AAC.1